MEIVKSIFHWLSNMENVKCIYCGAIITLGSHFFGLSMCYVMTTLDGWTDSLKNKYPYKN